MANFSNFFRTFEENARIALSQFVQKAGVIMINHFKDSWRNQGFTDKALERWKERKIPNLYLKSSVKTTKTKSTFTLSKPASRAGKAILVLSGDLRRDIKKEVNGLTISASSSLPYAQIHNEGGMAGRGHKTRIERRQFMGDSEVMREKMIDEFNDTMLQTFNNTPS